MPNTYKGGEQLFFKQMATVNNNTSVLIVGRQQTTNSNFEIASTLCGFILLLVFSCSSVFSTSVLWALWKTKQLRCPVNRIIAFLLVDEVFVRIFGSPMIITSMLATRWLFGESGCNFYGFLMTWLGISATSLFTCVAIERYIVMCKPNFKRFLTTGVADSMAVFCYLHGLGWATFPLANEHGYVFEPSGISCTPDWSPNNIGYMLGLFNVCFMIPVLVSTFCYTSIFIKLRQKRRERVTLHHDASVEKHVAVTMAITLFAFLFTWTPYAVIGLTKMFGLEDSFNIAKEITLIPLIAAKTAGFWNAFVFSFRNREVRKVLSRKAKTLRERLTLKIVLRRQRNRITPRIEKSRSGSTVSLRSNRVSMFQVNITSSADGKLVPRAPTASSYVERTPLHIGHDYMTSSV